MYSLYSMTIVIEKLNLIKQKSVKCIVLVRSWHADWQNNTGKSVLPMFKCFLFGNLRGSKHKENCCAII